MSAFWTEDRIAKLRRRWSEGAGSATIACEIGATRNAVIGKAHRLGLEPRASPIVRGKAADFGLGQ